MVRPVPQRAAMRRRVDAAREAADDGDAARRQIGAEPLARFERDRGRRARADDGDGRRVEGSRG